MTENPRDGVDTGQLRQLVADTLELPVEEVTDEAHFVDDLDVDSLMAMEIMVHLEKRYQIKLDEAQFKEITSFQKVRELVASKLRESD